MAVDLCGFTLFYVDLNVLGRFEWFETDSDSLDGFERFQLDFVGFLLDWNCFSWIGLVFRVRMEV